MTDEREPIIAGNESAYRGINEAIERGRWPGEDNATAFRCECARRGCTEVLHLTRRQYERVRSDPRWFVVVPAHQDPEIEDVVEAHPGYVVVEKRGQAGDIAEASDPRS